ncbi:MAG TPA: hypothetical protein VFA99_04155 [Acidobacteriaceae bacterium]|nr:hypothetical protein [Acidobacteriaceae bacterium]
MNVRRPIALVLMIAGYACFAGSFGYYWHLRQNSPAEPDVTAGLVHPIDQHGHIIYVTGTQNLTFYGMLIGSAALFAIGYFARKRTQPITQR